MNVDYIILRGVEIGLNPSIDSFVIVGRTPKGIKEGEQKTWIGTDSCIRSHTVIYSGNRIGDRFQTGHGVLIREDNEIGHDVSIGSSSVIEHHITINDGVRVHSNVFVPEYTVLEAGCWLGPNVVITNAKYPQSPDAKRTLKGAHIEQNARIGANATLLPGVRIGKNALVGAGAVVTKDVPPDSVVVGNPAQVIKSISSLPYN